MLEMTRPPQNSSAAANIDIRGPTRSTHFPANAAARPRKMIAMLKIQVTLAIDQSPGVSEIAFEVAGGHACCMLHNSCASGLLKTLHAYAWPMQRWMQSAAGGTSHRLNPGRATE